MPAKVKSESRSLTVQLTAEDAQVLQVLKDEMLATSSDVIRWALRFYALHSPEELVPKEARKWLRAQFGLLPVGPFRYLPDDGHCG